VDAGGGTNALKVQSLPDATRRWEDACAVGEKMTAIWIEKKLLPIHGSKRGGSKPTATGSMQPLLSPYKFIVIIIF
jgi:hypothetical protein